MTRLIGLIMALAWAGVVLFVTALAALGALRAGVAMPLVGLLAGGAVVALILAPVALSLSGSARLFMVLLALGAGAAAAGALVPTLGQPMTPIGTAAIVTAALAAVTLFAAAAGGSVGVGIGALGGVAVAATLGLLALADRAPVIEEAALVQTSPERLSRSDAARATEALNEARARGSEEAPDAAPPRAAATAPAPSLPATEPTPPGASAPEPSAPAQQAEVALHPPPAPADSNLPRDADRGDDVIVPGEARSSPAQVDPRIAEQRQNDISAHATIPRVMTEDEAAAQLRTRSRGEGRPRADVPRAEMPTATAPQVTAPQATTRASVPAQAELAPLRFNRPQEMRINRSYVVEARIGAGQVASLGTAGPTVEREVRIPESRRVRVELISDAFTVKKLHTVDDPVIAPGGTGLWSWRVTPTRGGQQTLLLQVFGVEGATGAPSLIEAYREEIPVTITPIDRAELTARSFLSRWELIGGIAGAVSGIWVFLTGLFGFVRRRREEAAPA